MNLGGPVWHASAAPVGAARLQPEILRAAALLAIKSLGDAALGEWEEWAGYAFHVRRRLSAREQQSVGPVVDIRGTAEAAQRLARVRHLLPPGYSE